MSNAVAMGPFERVSDLDGVTQCVIDRQRAFLEPIRERLAFQVLHHQVIGAVLMADVVKRADVRMVQRSHIALLLQTLR